eukprot:5274733-Pyramimonas_sp.AAC.2
MPSLSPTMTEVRIIRRKLYCRSLMCIVQTLAKHFVVGEHVKGSIAGWKKNVGDKINAGDILCDIQTVR